MHQPGMPDNWYRVSASSRQKARNLGLSSQSKPANSPNSPRNSSHSKGLSSPKLSHKASSNSGNKAKAIKAVKTYLSLHSSNR